MNWRERQRREGDSIVIDEHTNLNTAIDIRSRLLTLCNIESDLKMVLKIRKGK